MLHHADDMGHRLLGVPTLGMAGDVTGERHDAVGHLNQNLVGVQCQVPIQFFHHPLCKRFIGIHKMLHLYSKHLDQPKRIWL